MAITPRGIYINYQYLHMGIVYRVLCCVTCLQTTAQVWGQHVTPHNTYNNVIGLVSRHPTSEWRFGVQMNNCLKFDNDELEQNKQGFIVKNMASDTQSCMQGQSWQSLWEFNHQKKTMDTTFPNNPVREYLVGNTQVKLCKWWYCMKHCVTIKSRQPSIVRPCMKYKHSHTLGF